MRVGVIVPFLNEEELLPVLLETLATQTRPPAALVLVDDGSTDGSAAIARAFCDRTPWARYLRRPPRPPERDRLVTASVVRAFHDGVDALSTEVDIVAKVDADLRLPPDLLATVVDAMATDPQLGIAGAYLRARDARGRLTRERTPSDHVRGPNKFYRWSCFVDIRPIPALLGWDTIDEATARLRGWRTASLAVPSGDPEHLRKTGIRDGRLRGHRRHGRCAWSYGAHPLFVALAAISRCRDRPLVFGGVAYFVGWFAAAVRRLPRASTDVRQEIRREQWARLRRLLAARRVATATPG